MEEFDGFVPRMHALETLLPKVSLHLSLKVQHIDLLEDLDRLYIDARYPSDLGLLPEGKPTLEDAQAFYVLANAIFEQVQEGLEKG